MNMLSTEFKPANARLADFTQGWERHPDHPGLITIKAGYTDIFLAAANDESCQAAILAVEESQKHIDREAFRQTVMQTRGMQNKSPMGVAYSQDKGIHNPHGHLDTAAPQISELTIRHAQMANEQTTLTSILENFGRHSTEKHPKHSRPVSNRVFFAGGTKIKTNEGWAAAPEGDFLYLKAGVEHEPNLERTPNADFDKILILTRAKYIYSYE